MTPTNSVKAAFSPSRRHQHQRTNHNRESRTSETSSTFAFGSGGKESGHGPEDRLLTNSSTLPRASELQHSASALQQHLQQHQHSSPGRQGSLNDSVGNQ